MNKIYKIGKKYNLFLIGAFTGSVLTFLYNKINKVINTNNDISKSFPNGTIDIKYLHGRRNIKEYICRIKENEKFCWNKVKCDKEDVTEKILKYAGPFKNFLNTNITPKDLGYNNLVFYKGQTAVKQFWKDDLIKF